MPVVKAKGVHHPIPEVPVAVAAEEAAPPVDDKRFRVQGVRLDVDEFTNTQPIGSKAKAYQVEANQKPSYYYAEIN